MDQPLLWFMDGSFLSGAGSFLLSSHARAAALLLLCFYLLKTIGRSASYRHLLLSSILVALLFLPGYSLLLPAVEVLVEVSHSSWQMSDEAGVVVPGGDDLQPWDLVDWLVCAILFYAAGVLVQVVRLLWSNLLVWLLTCCAVPVRERSWWDGLARATAQLGVRRSVELRYSRAISSPVTWGVIRPVVLLPLAARNWSAELIYSTLLHESAHIRRCDWLAQQLARLTCALYWPNPLAWRALRQMENNAESACDDLVLSAGVTSTRYASDLLTVARQVSSCGGVRVAALAMSHSREPSELANRVRAILSPAISRVPSSRLQTAVTLVLIMFVVLPVSSLRAIYTEVPVFPAGQLTPLVSKPKTTPPADPGPRQPEVFNREEIKQAAVVELRRTLAKLNASGRQWMAAGDQPADQKNASGAQSSARKQQRSQTPDPVVASAEKPVEGKAGADQENKSESNKTASAPVHPLLALLRAAESRASHSASETYSYARLVKPRYPRRALDRGIEGEVVVSFNIDRHGRVVNPEIVRARPAGVFERPVLRALARFQFEPAVVDGVPVSVQGATEVFRFVLES